MACRILLPLLLLAAASPAALAVIDVTQMLADKSQYGTFLKLLTTTRVADDVSRLKTASLLVLPDKSIKPLLALPADKQRLAVANHVLLKYFDPIQLAEMKDRTAMLDTLLSVTDKRLGVVNYTKADDGQMYFRAPGAAGVAKLIKVVAARPFAVSIMEVSEAILPPELGGTSGVAAEIGGRRPKGGKGKKIRPSSDSFGVSKMDSNAAGKAAAKTSAGGAASESAPPSEAPTASPM